MSTYACSVGSGVLTGEFPPQAQSIEHGAPRLGDPRAGTPTAFMAAAYSEEEFRRLMRTGVALGDREIGLMTQMAQRRFTHMTNDELHALHTYLKERASSGPGISLMEDARNE